MKTIDYSYFIESYIAGEMSASEEVWFKKELQGNESLQKEVQLRKRTDSILRKNEVISLRNKLVSIEKMRQENPVRSKKINTPRFRYAAIVVGLLVIGSLLFNSFRKESSEHLFNNNYQTYSNPGSSRSAGTNFDAAYDNFNKGEFKKALEGFKSYLSIHPGSTKFEFLSGVANMEIKNYPDAKTSFKEVINDNNNLYIEDANWYLAMCYLITNDIVMTKDQLRKISKSESVYNNRAKRILRHL
jgi:TolA-binding protein